jgi:hypothetical protein
MRKAPAQLDAFSKPSAPTLREEAAQLELDRAGDAAAWEAIHTVCAKIVKAVTPKEMCWQLGVLGGQLSESVAGENKHLQLRWLPTFARVAPADLRAELQDALDALFGEEMLTPEEELQALRSEVIADCGRSGREAVERVRKMRKPRRSRRG